MLSELAYNIDYYVDITIINLSCERMLHIWYEVSRWEHETTYHDDLLSGEIYRRIRNSTENVLNCELVSSETPGEFSFWTNTFYNQYVQFL